QHRIHPARHHLSPRLRTWPGRAKPFAPASAGSSQLVYPGGSLYNGTARSEPDPHWSDSVKLASRPPASVRNRARQINAILSDYYGEAPRRNSVDPLSELVAVVLS